VSVATTGPPVEHRQDEYKRIYRVLFAEKNVYIHHRKQRTACGSTTVMAQGLQTLTVRRWMSGRCLIARPSSLSQQHISVQSQATDRSSNVSGETGSSADAEKPARRTYRSVKVTKHSTIPYVRYFSSCTTVTLSLRRAVFPIFDFKNAVTLKTGLGVRQGHRKCHRAIERMTSCWRSIVTMALSRVVSEIFNVENVVTLTSGQRSLKVIESGTIR